ncbi:MAG: family 43 glycosylhydrolase [Bacteroidaceae bacterium]|nr:family 43 glycosylhydrolase [Bacteroidaceae bacterium]
MKYFLSLLSLALFISCQEQKRALPSSSTGDMTLLMDSCSYPHAILHEGKYYFTCQPDDETIRFRVTDDLRNIPEAKEYIAWRPDSLHMDHFWAPEMHYIRGQWYIYFEADDGNTDNHQLYVLTCSEQDSTTGSWQLCGALQTNPEWNFGLHPNVLVMPDDRLYLLWSGWPQRRAETETQCIYIAQLSDPCTVASQRVMLSSPDLEWERQWINPDGSRSAYPIYVNENPQACLTPDGRRVCIFYSASGIWTVFNSLGCLTADAEADLLDPASWTKATEPLTLADSTYYGTSNICIVPKTDGTLALLFEAKNLQQGEEHRSTYIRDISFDSNGGGIGYSLGSSAAPSTAWPGVVSASRGK